MMLLSAYLYIKRRRKKILYGLLLAALIPLIWRVMLRNQSTSSISKKRAEPEETCIALFLILHFRVTLPDGIADSFKKRIKNNLREHVNVSSEYFFLDDRISDNGLPQSMQDSSYYIRGPEDGHGECGYVWSFDSKDREIMYDTCKEKSLKSFWKFCKLPQNIVEEVTTQKSGNFNEYCMPNFAAGWPLRDITECLPDSGNDASEWVKYARSLDKELKNDKDSKIASYPIISWQVLGLVVEYDKSLLSAGFNLISTTEAMVIDTTTSIKPRFTENVAKRELTSVSGFSRETSTTMAATSTLQEIDSKPETSTVRIVTSTVPATTYLATDRIFDHTFEDSFIQSSGEGSNDEKYDEQAFLDMIKEIYPDFFQNSTVSTIVPTTSGSQRIPEEGSGFEKHHTDAYSTPPMLTSVVGSFTTTANDLFQDLLSLKDLVYRIYGVVLDNIPMPLQSLLHKIHNDTDHTHIDLPDDTDYIKHRINPTSIPTPYQVGPTTGTHSPPVESIGTSNHDNTPMSNFNYVQTTSFTKQTSFTTAPVPSSLDIEIPEKATYQPTTLLNDVLPPWSTEGLLTHISTDSPLLTSDVTTLKSKKTSTTYVPSSLDIEIPQEATYRDIELGVSDTTLEMSIGAESHTLKTFLAMGTEEQFAEKDSEVGSGLDIFEMTAPVLGDVTVDGSPGIQDHTTGYLRVEGSTALTTPDLRDRTTQSFTTGHVGAERSTAVSAPSTTEAPSKPTPLYSQFSTLSYNNKVNNLEVHYTTTADHKTWSSTRSSVATTPVLSTTPADSKAHASIKLTTADHMTGSSAQSPEATTPVLGTTMVDSKAHGSTSLAGLTPSLKDSRPTASMPVATKPFPSTMKQDIITYSSTLHSSPTPSPIYYQPTSSMPVASTRIVDSTPYSSTLHTSSTPSPMDNQHTTIIPDYSYHDNTVLDSNTQRDSITPTSQYSTAAEQAVVSTVKQTSIATKPPFTEKTRILNFSTPSTVVTRNDQPHSQSDEFTSSTSTSPVSSLGEITTAHATTEISIVAVTRENSNSVTVEQETASEGFHPQSITLAVDRTLLNITERRNVSTIDIISSTETSLQGNLSTTLGVATPSSAIISGSGENSVTPISNEEEMDSQGNFVNATDQTVTGPLFISGSGEISGGGLLNTTMERSDVQNSSEIIKNVVSFMPNTTVSLPVNATDDSSGTTERYKPSSVFSPTSTISTSSTTPISTIKESIMTVTEIDLSNTQIPTEESSTVYTSLNLEVSGSGLSNITSDLTTRRPDLAISTAVSHDIDITHATTHMPDTQIFTELAHKSTAQTSSISIHDITTLISQASDSPISSSTESSVILNKTTPNVGSLDSSGSGSGFETDVKNTSHIGNISTNNVTELNQDVNNPSSSQNVTIMYSTTEKDFVAFKPSFSTLLFSPTSSDDNIDIASTEMHPSQSESTTGSNDFTTSFKTTTSRDDDSSLSSDAMQLNYWYKIKTENPDTTTMAIHSSAGDAHTQVMIVGEEYSLPSGSTQLNYEYKTDTEPIFTTTLRDHSPTSTNAYVQDTTMTTEHTFTMGHATTATSLSKTTEHIPMSTSPFQILDPSTRNDLDDGTTAGPTTVSTSEFTTEVKGQTSPTQHTLAVSKFTVGIPPTPSTDTELVQPTPSSINIKEEIQQTQHSSTVSNFVAGFPFTPSTDSGLMQSTVSTTDLTRRTMPIITEMSTTDAIPLPTPDIPKSTATPDPKITQSSVGSLVPKVEEEISFDPVTEVASAVVGRWFEYQISRSWIELLKKIPGSKISVTLDKIESLHNMQANLIAEYWLEYNDNLKSLCGVPVARNRTQVSQISSFTVNLRAQNTILSSPIMLHISLYPLPDSEKLGYEVTTVMDVKSTSEVNLLKLESKYPAVFTQKLASYFTQKNHTLSKSAINMLFFDKLLKRRKKRSIVHTVKVVWNIKNIDFKTFNSSIKEFLIDSQSNEPYYDFFIAMLPEFIVTSTKVAKIDLKGHSLISDGAAINLGTILPPVFLGIFAIAFLVTIIFIRKRKSATFFFVERFLDTTYKPRKPVFLDGEIEMDHFKPGKAKIIDESNLSENYFRQTPLSNSIPRTFGNENNNNNFDVLSNISDLDDDLTSITSIAGDGDSVDGFYSFTNFSFHIENESR